MKEEQKSTRGNQTKTAAASHDANADEAQQHATGDNRLLTETVKTSLDSGEALKVQEKFQPKMDAEIMEQSYGSDGAPSLCLSAATVMPIDANHYDAGINCQMVALNAVQLVDSMLSDLSMQSENGGVVVNNGDIDAHLMAEGERLPLL